MALRKADDMWSSRRASAGGLPVAIFIWMNLRAGLAASESPSIAIRLDLETSDYKVGSPVAGYVVLTNTSPDTIWVTDSVGPESGALDLTMTRPDGSIIDLHREPLSDYYFAGPGQPIAPGGLVRYPLFVVGRLKGDLALALPGRYTLSGSLLLGCSYRGKPNWAARGVLPETAVEVKPAAKGYERYRSWILSEGIWEGVFNRMDTFARLREDWEDWFGDYARDVAIVGVYNSGTSRFCDWLRSGGRRFSQWPSADEQREEFRQMIVRGARFSEKCGVGWAVWREAARIYESSTGRSLNLRIPPSKEESGTLVFDQSKW